MEVLRGKLFHDVLRERLVDPLGLAAVATSADEAILCRTAVGHLETDGVIRHRGLTGRGEHPNVALGASHAPNATLGWGIGCISRTQCHIGVGYWRGGLTGRWGFVAVRSRGPGPVPLPEMAEMTD
nr:hypothetical protein [Amycolatopsis benzoatilytica]